MIAIHGGLHFIACYVLTIKLDILTFPCYLPTCLLLRFMRKYI